MASFSACKCGVHAGGHEKRGYKRGQPVIYEICLVGLASGMRDLSGCLNRLDGNAYACAHAGVVTGPRTGQRLGRSI